MRDEFVYGSTETLTMCERCGSTSVNAGWGGSYKCLICKENSFDPHRTVFPFEVCKKGIDCTTKSDKVIAENMSSAQEFLTDEQKEQLSTIKSHLLETNQRDDLCKFAYQLKSVSTDDNVKDDKKKDELQKIVEEYLKVSPNQQQPQTKPGAELGAKLAAFLASKKTSKSKTHGG